LSAVLNSSIPNALMKDFQSKGLFGPRHVSKKILDIYFPKYSDSENLHIKLAKLGEQCHEKAKAFVAKNNYPANLSARELGKMRLEIKKELAKEMEEIDKLVKKLL
jgi:hypothetical protein